MYKSIRPIARLMSAAAIITLSGIALAEGAISKLKSNEAVTIDSVKLAYESINADAFPRIVSLVTVINNAGFVIGKLDENNFEVHEDNVRELPIEVVELTNDSSVINVALVIDRSGSMKGQPIDDAKDAATIFVNLMQGRDQSAVVSFSTNVRTDHFFSSNKDSLVEAIDDIESDGRTAVFDAVLHAVYLFNDALKNRAIILMTDGADNSSRHSYQEALTACLSNEIRVFSIGLGLRNNSPEEDTLKDLANQTGGMYYYSPTSSDLEAIYRAISQLLHHRYQVSYATHNPKKDGTLRHVQIDVFVNTSTSWDTANYRAPFEPDPVDTLDPVDPKPVEPPFEVVPNPFTPNDDGFNDWTEFKQGDNTPTDWSIAILDRSGRLIRTFNNGDRIWDGKDRSGRLVFPGIYLYVVSKGNRAIHRGMIQVIR